MVPSALVVLEALPLTPNGKVDRKALPAPDRASIGLEDFVAPRDALEIELVRIWEELLRVQPISVTSNFFELGGHSLLGVELTARIRESTGRHVPLAALFEGSTVEKLAAFMRQEPRPWSPLVPIWRGGSQTPFFCVHPAGGNVACYAGLARALGPDQPFYGLQAPGLDGEQPPHETLESLAALYVDAIRTVQPAGPYRLGGWSLGGTIAFEMARQLRSRGEEVALLALFDSWTQSVRPGGGRGRRPRGELQPRLREGSGGALRAEARRPGGGAAPHGRRGGAGVPGVGGAEGQRRRLGREAPADPRPARRLLPGPPRGGQGTSCAPTTGPSPCSRRRTIRLRPRRRIAAGGRSRRRRWSCTRSRASTGR